MLDIKYFTRLLFNEKTGKEHYSLIPKEAEKIFNENSRETVGKWQWNVTIVNCIIFNRWEFIFWGLLEIKSH
jgi:hypothetical protein